jgi:hypothetical protein
VYQCDQVTPAYEFDDPTFIPVDIANPAVREWRLENEIGPLLAAGYAGISVDNIFTDNPFGSCGTFSGPGGTWVQRYTGQRYGDETFVDDQVAWLEALGAFVHARANACVSGNIEFHPNRLAAVQRLARSVDIVFDEGGFNGPQALCQVGGGDHYRLFGDGWRSKFRFFTDLRQPFVLGNNGLCPVPGENSVPVIDWALASYLLVKNDRSYIGWVEQSSASFEEISRFDLNHGRAEGTVETIGSLFVRRFARTLVVLNSSANEPATLNLERSDYHDTDGKVQSASLRLPAKRAKILQAPN